MLGRLPKTANALEVLRFHAGVACVAQQIPQADVLDLVSAPPKHVFTETNPVAFTDDVVREDDEAPLRSALGYG